VQLRLVTRRFTCEVPHCRRRIFAERFGERVVPARSRRTARLEYIVHHLGLALGGRPAAALARRLMLPVSNDTLLHRRCHRGSLVDARYLIERFQAMVRQKAVAELEPWIAAAGAGLIGSFASGILKDKAAVCAAITEAWSNGQTEGQITKLKLISQMYGRAKIDLLQARLIGAV